MKSILLAASAIFCVSACSTSSGPATAWGKEGVSMLDYRTDGGQCAVYAATATPDFNGANTAGGVSGQNSQTPAASGLPNVPVGQGAGPNPGAAVPTSGGVYRESASPDFVQRAATQQQQREMAIQRARTQMLKSCLTERGYKEFELTAEQRAHLATLPQGSDQRREYLYKLATDPQVLAKQPAVKSGS